MRKYGLYMENMPERINLTEKLKRESEGSLEKPSAEKDRGKKKSTPKARKNGFGFDGGTLLKEIPGIDPTKVEGIEVKTIPVFLSATGMDTSKWRSAEAFAPWLCPAPRPNISNSKLKGHGHRKTTNPAT
ncbi:MAG: transposase, partial [Tannerella sp.]|jgi:hypothetical protein|nr:transposase [Tannerella sp.]